MSIQPYQDRMLVLAVQTRNMDSMSLFERIKKDGSRPSLYPYRELKPKVERALNGLSSWIAYEMDYILLKTI